MGFNIISAAEAASYIKHGDNVGLSGFTPAGTPKAVTPEIAKLAEVEHASGRPFQISIFTGASTGDSADGELTRVNALRYRAPYTTNNDFRKEVNLGNIAYNDIHLSQMAQELRYGYFGKMNVAIIEACEVTPDGKVFLTAGSGITPTIARMADKIIIELNAAHRKECIGLHDVYEPMDPPYRKEIPIYKPSDRIGTPYLQVDPAKIVGIVEVNLPDDARGFTAPDAITDKIGQNVADFLIADMKRGIIPSSFLPLQSGVGNIANAVLGALGRDKFIPQFEMYTEVLQESVVDLIRSERIKFASTCSLSVTNDCLQGIYDDFNFFKDKLVIRPSEISNNPEIVRRLGLISMNTAIEADIYGNVNSTHIAGTKMMNGIGGSGDFTRNAYISIFSCPSVAKEGKISAIVPMVSHHDHSEHDVNIIITEQGIADLRGKSPMERAKTVIENCAHPDYKQLLWDYLKITSKGHTCQSMSAALGMHDTLLRKGDMRLTDWAEYVK
ncbi:MAG: acetyl-CoA hydrolase/transferase family protein [Parabacteroides sp.]|nr:acetyl-CoA hydrolase/transferase family protein [Parabacteroides sp.]